MAVLVLAGCGDGEGLQTPRAKQAEAQAQASAAAATGQEWDVLVRAPEHKLQALTDLTAWLMEHGFNFYLVKKDGEDRVLLGPFSSREQAEARQAQLTEKLARAKKSDTESLIIEHEVTQ